MLGTLDIIFSRFWSILLVIGIKVDLVFFYTVSKNINHSGNLRTMKLSQFESRISIIFMLHWVNNLQINNQTSVYNDKYG